LGSTICYCPFRISLCLYHLSFPAAYSSTLTTEAAGFSETSVTSLYHTHSRTRSSNCTIDFKIYDTKRRTDNEQHSITVWGVRPCSPAQSSLTFRMNVLHSYCDGFVQGIAGQRLGKHVPTHRRPKQYGISVFYVFRATQQKRFLCGPQ
jgi:hypothetical protein